MSQVRQGTHPHPEVARPVGPEVAHDQGTALVGGGRGHRTLVPPALSPRPPTNEKLPVWLPLLSQAFNYCIPMTLKAASPEQLIPESESQMTAVFWILL